jgi:DnaJ-class molecular chaperone
MRGTRVRNLYKVLGIASTADDRRIKSAFRNRAKAVHPDLNPGSERAEERFKELMEAYKVLRNATARAAYDALLAQRRRAVHA